MNMELDITQNKWRLVFLFRVSEILNQRRNHTRYYRSIPLAKQQQQKADLETTILHIDFKELGLINISGDPLISELIALTEI